MSSPIPAQRERSALSDLFDDVGPDAPTLSGEWTTRDLAAHLVIREGRPDAAPGILLPFLSGYTDRVQTKAADAEWSDLVDQIRQGPPKWSPMRFEAVDRAMNTIEYFVNTTFNYPTMAEAYRVAAINGLDRANLTER